MKNLLPIALVVAAGAGFGLAQEGTPPETAGTELEKRVEALEQQVATLKRDVGRRSALLEDTVRYLNAQSKAAEKILATFDQSEKEGFTAGINFTSRKTLLAGLRTYMEAQKTGLPGSAPKVEEKPADPTVGQR